MITNVIPQGGLAGHGRTGPPPPPPPPPPPGASDARRQVEPLWVHLQRASRGHRSSWRSARPSGAVFSGTNSGSSYRTKTTRSSQSARVYSDNLTPRGWAYTPDLSRPAELKLTQTSRNARLTWQAAPKHKFSAFVDNAPQITFHTGSRAQFARGHQHQSLSAEHLHDPGLEVADKQSMAPRGLARAQFVEL